MENGGMVSKKALQTSLSNSYSYMVMYSFNAKIR